MGRWVCGARMVGSGHPDWLALAHGSVRTSPDGRVGMPWFISLAALVAYGCTSAALRIHRGEGRRPWQAFVMVALGWYPVLIWLIAQFIPDLPR